MTIFHFRLDVLVPVYEAFDGGDWKLAKQLWEAADLEIEERVLMWEMFDSRMRAYLRNFDRVYLKDPNYE